MKCSFCNNSFACSHPQGITKEQFDLAVLDEFLYFWRRGAHVDVLMSDYGISLTQLLKLTEGRVKPGKDRKGRYPNARSVPAEARYWEN